MVSGTRKSLAPCHPALSSTITQQSPEKLCAVCARNSDTVNHNIKEIKQVKHSRHPCAKISDYTLSLKGVAAEKIPYLSLANEA
jgi:hypothetical protein